ncbi:MAG: GntR family transcriptional regulator [Canibacter sp.]
MNQSRFSPVDQSSSIPLYLQIVSQIDDQIRRGRLAAGMLLPPEVELCHDFGVARATLRKAFESLQKKGLISRERGRYGGTRIQDSRPISREPGGFVTVYDMIAASERKPKTRLAVAEILEVDSELSDLTRFPVGESVFHLVRYRSANDLPIAVLENWILTSKIQFNLARLQNESLEALLRDGGTSAESATFEYRPIRAGKYADFLQIEEGEPVINEVRYVTAGGEQYDCSHHISHPHHERVGGVATK